MNYKFLNNVLGWLMFVVALVVYTLTLEPSVSYWDCGEFISASDKLQVVHPPGAPFFLLVGRLFALFAPKASDIAFYVNMVSGISSAFTVMFTFWITTYFASKMLKKEMANKGTQIAIFGSGIIAALALTFSDSFWFSAVEAEVYAMSSFFTALTFWAVLKWDASESKLADKWLLFIAYMIGLAIGTHLLNLLVIPAVVFVYYFKKFDKITNKGLAITFLIGMGILFFVQKAIIPGIPSLMKRFDLLFVNSFGMSFNSGSIFAILLLVGGTAYGIYHFTVKNPKPVYNLALLCFSFILLGYSTYAMVVVRSADNPAIDMNNPEEPINLLSYINREQYGDRPLLYGPYYNTRPVDVKELGTIYRKGKNSYEDIGNKQEYIYDPNAQTLFPRMGDANKESGDVGYRFWSNMTDIDNQINSIQSELQNAKSPEDRQRLSAQIEELKAEKPSMKNNLTFLFRYQLGFMYFRYFFWNFVGRQNDYQGHSFNYKLHGNWISGINFIDEKRLGPQKNMPEDLANNKARNKFYFIPLILGILGLVFHFKKGQKDAIVTGILFIFTGILIIIFLNQPPFEPRERDYSMVGSFQTFCIWIGLGVLFLWQLFKDRFKLDGVVSAFIASVLALSGPVLMGTQGWDDHDRSGRYLAIDFARNYLNSCPPNAVLFTNGDNDTYPLWYAQNVEGVRRDIRIINQSLLPTDWYSQVLLTKVYESEPLPLSLTKEQLAAGNNDYFQFQQSDPNRVVDLSTFVSNLAKSMGKRGTYDVKNFIVPVNKEAALASGTVKKEDESLIIDQIRFSFPKGGLTKGDLVLLDLIATNAATGWKRPICFSSTSGSEGYSGLDQYLERRGYVYQFVPIRTPENRGNEIKRVDKEGLYDNLMNKFAFSNMSGKKNFFLDDKAEITASVLQNMFVSLSAEYATEMAKIKDSDSSLSNPENAARHDLLKNRIKELMAKCEKEIPASVLITKGITKFNFAAIYQEIGDKENCRRHLEELFKIHEKEVKYYIKFNGKSSNSLMHLQNCKDAFDMLDRVRNFAKQWGFNDLYDQVDKSFKDLEAQTSAYLNNYE